MKLIYYYINSNALRANESERRSRCIDCRESAIHAAAGIVTCLFCIFVVGLFFKERENPNYFILASPFTHRAKLALNVLFIIIVYENTEPIVVI